MKLLEFAQQFGSHKAARALIDKHLKKTIGIGINEFPDIPEMNSHVETVQAFIEQSLLQKKLMENEIKEALNNITGDEDALMAMLFD